MDRHVDELADLYALGALEPDEQSMVDRHLEQCEECRGRVAESRQVVAHLLWSPPQHDPPPGLQRKIVKRIEQVRRQEQSEQAPRAARPVFSLQRSVRGGLLAAALGALLILAGWNVALRREVAAQAAQLAARARVDEMLRTPDARVIVLAPQPAAPRATGKLLVDPAGTDAYHVTAGLPTLPSDKGYQLWLLEGEERTSGGVFRVDERGAGSLLVRSPHPLEEYTGCGITIEPATGSDRPTGERVLRSQAWSYEDAEHGPGS